MSRKIKRDITIRFIPNLLEDKGRTLQSFSYDRTLTILRYLEKTGINYTEMRVSVNGNEILNLNQMLQSGDEIVVSPNIAWPLAVAFGKWFAMHWVTYTLFAISTIYSVYAALTKPKLPSFNTTGFGMDEDSPSHSWTGVRTLREPGSSVPIIYGRYLTGGVVINEYITTDGDKNYLNSLVAIGEGLFRSITLKRINRNPAENFEGYSVDTRLGTNDQSVIPNFEDLHNLFPLNIELTKNNPYVYTTEALDVEAFEMKLALPAGLFKQDNQGNVLSWSVTYKVEYKIHTDPEYTDLGSTTINAKSRSEVRRTFRKDGLTAGQYDIRITKTSDDSSLELMTNGDLYLVGADEINTDDLEYPNTGLAGIQALATEQLSGSSPQYEFEAERMVLIPKVLDEEEGEEVDWEAYYWDPDTEQYRLFEDDSVLYWDGTTYSVSFSANPIWCLYDLMINSRYGIGNYISTDDHDLDYLLEISRCCEEKVPDGEGGYEKRYRMDVCIDSPQKALDLVMQLSTIFRGLPFYSDNGKIRIAIDKPDTSVQLFGMGNIVKESFSQNWTSKRDIPNLVYVQYDNKDSYYQQEKIEVNDPESLQAGKPINRKEVRYYGTKLSYAIRYGRNLIKTAKYINRVISIKGGSGALVRQCGEVIDIAHDVPQFGFSGRVQTGSTTTKVKLDRSVIIEVAKSYVIRVDFNEPNEDGSARYEERIVIDAPGTYTEVNVSVAFSKAPVNYDIYSFGEVNKVVFPARITSLNRQRMGEVEIDAIEYNENIYDDSTVIIPERKVSSLQLDIPPVENLVLTESIITLGDGTIESTIDVWFTKPVLTEYSLKRYSKARIYISDDAGESYTLRGETSEEFFKIQGSLSIGVEYKVLVTSVTDENEELDKISSPSDTITLVGKDSPPNNVTNFAYTFTNELVLTWDKNTNKDLGGYEIRTEDANWGAQNSHLIYHGQANTFTIVLPASRTPGTYYIRAYDTTGNYSSTSDDVTPENTAPTAPTVQATQWFGFAKLEWTDAVDNDLKYYEVYKSHTGAWGGEEFSEAKVAGKAAIVQGSAPVDAKADSVSSTSITDADLIGKGVDAFVGDIILQTSGTYKEQSAVVTAFNNTTGQISVASWPSGTPDEEDEFVIKDRAHYKVRGVDTYGGGNFSSDTIIDFAPLTEAEIGDAIISARKLIAGEVITLSAQIKDLIVTSAKIYDLDGVKIQAQTITLSKLGADAIPSKTYYQAGEPDTGMNEGDYWIDTDDSNKLYIYQDAEWELVSEGTGAGGITVFRQTAIPTSLAVGDLWIDTDDGDKLYRADSIGADEIAAGEWELVNIATASGWAHGSDITKIDGGKIYTGSITADKIDVSQLDALAINTGTLTVDETIDVGDGHVIIDGGNNVIKVYDDAEVLRVELGELS